MRWASGRWAWGPPRGETLLLDRLLSGSLLLGYRSGAASHQRGGGLGLLRSRCNGLRRFTRFFAALHDDSLGSFPGLGSGFCVVALCAGVFGAFCGVISSQEGGHKLLTRGVRDNLVGRIDIAREVFVENFCRALEELLNARHLGGGAGAEQLAALIVVEGPVCASLAGGEVVECS